MMKVLQLSIGLANAYLRSLQESLERGVLLSRKQLSLKGSPRRIVAAPSAARPFGACVDFFPTSSMFTFTTILDLDEAMMQIQSYMTQQRGYILSHKDGGTLTFTKTEKPSALTFIILLFFFIIPALLYLVLAWKKKTCSMYFKKEKNGTKVMVDGGYGKTILRQLAKFDDTLKALPEAKLSFWESNTPLYVFFGVIGVVLVLIAIIAILPR